MLLNILYFKIGPNKDGMNEILLLTTVLCEINDIQFISKCVLHSVYKNHDIN